MNIRTQMAAVTAFDPDELSAKLDSHGDFEHSQMSFGRFRARFMRSEIGDSILNLGTYSRDVSVRGTYPEDRITLGLILSARQPGYFNGMRLAVNDIIVIAEGGAMEPYVLPAGTRRLVIQTPRHQLERQELNIPERGEIVLHSRFSPDVLHLSRFLQAFVNSQIEPDRRQLLDTPVLEDDLIAGFRRAIDSAAGLNERTLSPNSRKRARLLRLLEEYIQAHLSNDIRIPDLCAHLGISQKSLECLCKDIYGVPPRRYLTLKRLNSARQRLMTARHTYGTVAAVASSVGLKHLGRFSSTYRAYFGELPSQTLKRR